MSDQEYVRAGASRWRATAIFERLVHVAHEERPDSTIGLWTGLWDESGQCVEIRMKGVTAILAIRAIKGVCGQPWMMLRT